ncbi:MAG: hypothetical protein OEX08_01325 [Candidatus Nomurabacteria bacterium]|nr:hypothetical protein [Candidatus Nomurabacteria bacterium]
MIFCAQIPVVFYEWYKYAEDMFPEWWDNISSLLVPFLIGAIFISSFIAWWRKYERQEKRRTEKKKKEFKK